MKIDLFLKELREYWIANEIPNITDVNARFLRDLIKIQNTQNMLEIWTANWFSSINFWLELQKTWGKLTTIEFSINSHNQALDNFKTAWVDNVIKAIHGNALDEIPKLEEKYDFVFIDWMKRRTVDFLMLTWNKVLPGGIIVIDDVIKFREKMWGLWDYLEEQNIKYNIIPIDIEDWILMIIK